MNWSYFKSRTFWTIVGIFVVNGGNAIVGVLPPTVQTIVTGLLGILAVYFHTNPSQTYNAPTE